jgi:hypothetical protein
MAKILNGYFDLVHRRPLVALVHLFVVYIGAMFASFLVSLLLFAVIGVFNGYEFESRHFVLFDQISGLAFDGIFVIAASLYLASYLKCFIHTVNRSTGETSLAAVSELILSFVLLFAIVHYYIFLVSPDVAYSGLPPQPTLDEGVLSGMAGRIYGVIFYVPDLKLLVSFLYFSTVTTSTVGYGDILPVSSLARLATVIQIIVGFGLVAVALGGVLSNRD